MDNPKNSEEVRVEDAMAFKETPRHERSLHDNVIPTFPEGGLRGWLAVTGTFFTLFVASGFVSYAQISSPSILFSH